MKEEICQYGYLKMILLTLCTALSLAMNFVPSDIASFDIQTIYIELQHGFGGTSFVVTLLWGAFLFCQLKISKLKNTCIWQLFPVCIFLAVIWVMGKSFEIDNTLNALSCSYVQIFKTIIYVVGITNLLYQIGCLLKFFFDKAAYKRNSFNRDCFVLHLYRKHTFAASAGVLAVGTLPHLIASYPAGLSYDARLSLLYYFGLLDFSSHHPPFSTWLMGKVVSLGVMLGNSNLGIFFYCILQYLFFVLLNAYLIYTIRVFLKTPWWLQALTLFIALVGPYHAAYVGVMIKDVLYSYCLLLFVIEMIYFLRKDSPNVGHIFLLCSSAVLTILLRNNGKYVIYPVLLMLAWAIFRKRKKVVIVRFFLIILCITLCSVSVESYLMNRYVEEKGSIREALSLPFQQTARYLKYYGNEVTEEEKHAIEKVLDYDNLADLYDPLLSDPVKGTFQEESTKDDLISYFKVWIKQFLKHPWCYVEATLNQNYFLVYPMAELHAYFSQLIYDDPLYDILVQYLDIHEIDSSVFQGLSTIQALYVWTMVMSPGIGMLSNVGFYNILLLFVLIYAVKERCRQVLVLLLPLILTNLVIIAAPYVGPRYAFPVMYSMPCVVALYMAQRREQIEGSGKEKEAGYR